MTVVLNLRDHETNKNSRLARTIGPTTIGPRERINIEEGTPCNPVAFA